MITVRYPTGVCLVYNNAHFLRHGNGTWSIYTGDPDKGGDHIAFIQASAGVVVDWTPPCRIENPAEHQTDERSIRELSLYPERLKQGTPQALARLKRLLQDFDARTGCWK